MSEWCVCVCVCVVVVVVVIYLLKRLSVRKRSQLLPRAKNRHGPAAASRRSQTGRQCQPRTGGTPSYYHALKTDTTRPPLVDVRKLGAGANHAPAGTN